MHKVVVIGTVVVVGYLWRREIKRYAKKVIRGYDLKHYLQSLNPVDGRYYDI